MICNFSEIDDIQGFALIFVPFYTIINTINIQDVIALKRCLKIIIPVLLVIFSFCAIRWAFFDIQRIDGQELISQSVSPDGEYTVFAYLNNGGATTDYAVLCSVKNNNTKKEKNIYWNYHCQDAEIKWSDEDTVIINGIELDVDKDIYDYRND